MAYKKPNEFVDSAESYLDRLSIPLGVLSVAVLVGFVSTVTIAPDYGTSGLFDLLGQFAKFDTHVISWATALGVLVPIYVMGTNEFVETLKDKQELRSDEGVVTLVAVGIPLAFEFLQEAQNFVAGSTGAQLAVVLMYSGCLAVLTDISGKDFF